MDVGYVLKWILAVAIMGGALISVVIEIFKWWTRPPIVVSPSEPWEPPTPIKDLTALQAWHATLTLPALTLTPAPERAIEAGGTRFGGPVWLPDGEDWPVDKTGRPLEFVAQLDFGTLEPLPDFPTSGLAQFFIGRDFSFGVDYGDRRNDSARVLWRDGPLAGGGLHAVPPLKKGSFILWEAGDHTPFKDRSIREQGVALRTRRTERPATLDDWRITTLLSRSVDWPDAEDVELWADAWPESHEHHVGGHPAYTQSDIRGPGVLEDYDRTLLRLTCDDILNWGDGGEAIFLMRREDLLRRDFSRAVFSWDCS